MKSACVRILWTMILTFVLGAGNALAQDGGDAQPDLVPDSAEGLDEGTQPGWHPLLKASFNFALGHNSNVPGNVDGSNLNFGYLINGGLGYLNDTKEHEWLNALLWQLGYTRTPVVDALIKSVDGIDFKSTYLYHIPAIPWFGPFVAFRMSTPMLPGYDIRPGDSNVLKLSPTEEQQFDDDGNLVDEDGNAIDANHERVDTILGGNNINLTGPFAPLTLRESLGLFAIPVDKKAFKLDIRLGFGIWETFARDGYLVEDNEDTAEILELRQMQDPVQAGPELGFTASGLIRDNVTYAFNALLMQPVYHNADTDLEGFELLNAEFEFLLGIKLWEWASLDYSFKAYKQPLIVDDWQIQNGLLFSVNFSIVEAPPPPPPPPAQECKCPKEAEPAAETPPKEAEPATETPPKEAEPVTETPPKEAEPVTETPPKEAEPTT
ncbi:MAG: hypothetical protein GY847_02605 [Proteobacteria bacterium]|nr:hypothetical protein [Pseudomonadota bacterium]